ncbi:protein O-mannosyl-transferase 2-like isoform X2 [Pollicipes pollicipes]|nr:protein O-mannosyl-transferase 2-like isoform X2 [Pollicipes pollicipes]
MSFITVHDLTGSLPAATYAALFLTLDVGMTTISRFILLDPILMFFMVAATMFNFKINKYRAFSGRWWLNLALTGLMLGCVLSVKFVGVFVVALVGLYTVADLWSIFCDLSKPLSHTVKHFVARAACLIVLPMATYVLVYYIHDVRITKANDVHGMQGDGWLSAGTQMTLKNNDMFNVSQPKYLAYGSLVTLQTVGSYSSYLHSHNLSYPDWRGANTTAGHAYNLSEVHSVTGFRLKDQNNFWKILPHDEEEVPDWENPYMPPEPVLNGDRIRLVHNTTGRVLAVFHQRALKTSTQMLVGALPERQLQKYQSAFEIQAAQLDDEAQLEAINTTFSLFNPGLRCAVYASQEKLPEWAANQLEITCSKRLTDEGVTWTVHRHINPRLRNVTKHWRRFIPSLPRKFMETHGIITTVNRKLVPSRLQMMNSDHPWMWPVLYRGLHFSMQDPHRVYLLGTPPIWWANLLLLVCSCFIMAFIGYKETRRPAAAAASAASEQDQHARWRRQTGRACLWLLLAWAVHYLPFWTMSRILYFHHYFPALCYSCMLSGVVLDFLLTCLYRQLPEARRAAVYHWLVAVLVAALFYSFYLFHPLCYGMSGPRPKDGTNSTYYHLWWQKSWDF